MAFDPNDPGYAEDEVVVLKPPSIMDSFKNFPKRPCIRESILWSLNFGFFGGLAKFMTTSRFEKALFAATLTFSASWSIIYVACMFRNINEKRNVRQLEPVFKSYLEIYGTDKMPKQD